MFADNDGDFTENADSEGKSMDTTYVYSYIMEWLDNANYFLYCAMQPFVKEIHCHINHLYELFDMIQLSLLSAVK